MLHKGKSPPNISADFVLVIGSSKVKINVASNGKKKLL